MDFNEYSKKTGNGSANGGFGGNGGNLFDVVSRLAKEYDGKSQSELIKAIFKEAEKGKRNGTLSNAEIDNFAKTLSPFLDDKQRAMLNKVVKELKKI